MGVIICSREKYDALLILLDIVTNRISRLFYVKCEFPEPEGSFVSSWKFVVAGLCNIYQVVDL